MEISLQDNNAVIKFRFDKQIVADIKKIDWRHRKYDSPSSSWYIELHDRVADRFIFFINKYRNIITEMPEEFRELLFSEEEIDEQESAIEITGLKRTLRDFQKEGCAYMINTKRCFNSDDMGLGKTIQTIATIHHLQKFPVLILCPASVKYNWKNEIMATIEGPTISVMPEGGSEADIVIINYDQVKKLKTDLIKRNWQVLVCDESHMLKGSKTQRVKTIKEIIKKRKMEYRFLLSGTPIVNRPSELISQLDIMDRLNDMGGFYYFVRRYCGAVDKGFGLDIKGASNVQELHNRLKETCFIRRLKEDVLKELPDKQICNIEVDITNRSEYNAAKKDLIKYLRQNAGARAANSAQMAENLVRISNLRRIAAIGKINAAKEWIENFLESGEKLVVFASSKQVISELSAHFKCDKIDGTVDAKIRAQVVAKFQEDPRVKMIIIGIQAGNAGITLTAASNELFIEQDWSPATLAQCIARCHRMGQKNSVTATFMLASNTIDEDMFILLALKTNVTDAVNSGKEFIEDQSILNELIIKMLS